MLLTILMIFLMFSLISMAVVSLVME